MQHTAVFVNVFHANEMWHLLYNELGGVTNISITTTHNANYGLFQNVQPNFYWSGTGYAPIPGHYLAFNFGMTYGPQAVYPSTSGLYAWAVRPGQSVVAAVPEPEMVAMLLAGLGLMGFTARRRKQSA